MYSFEGDEIKHCVLLLLIVLGVTIWIQSHSGKSEFISIHSTKFSIGGYIFHSLALYPCHLNKKKWHQNENKNKKEFLTVDTGFDSSSHIHESTLHKYGLESNFLSLYWSLVEIHV